MPISLLSHDGAYNSSSKTIVIPSGTTLLIVHAMGQITGMTVNGVSIYDTYLYRSLSIPQNHGFTHVFYMFDPPIGSVPFALTTSGGYRAFTITYWSGEDRSNTFSAVSSMTDEATDTTPHVTMTGLNTRNGVSFLQMGSYNNVGSTGDSPQIDLTEYRGNFAGSSCSYMQHTAETETMGFTLSGTSWIGMSAFVIYAKPSFIPNIINII